MSAKLVKYVFFYINYWLAVKTEERKGGIARREWKIGEGNSVISLGEG